MPIETPLRPAQLPAALGSFAGRAAEVAAIGAAPVSTIAGPAGMGKTALALHCAHRLADRFPDGQIYLDLSGAIRPERALRHLLGALAVPPDRVPADLGEQVACYRTLMAGRRMLLVLDDARDAAQVHPLLPGAPTCRTIVTSRAMLTDLVVEGARPVTLAPLPDREAGELLAGRIGAGRLAASPGGAVLRCASARARWRAARRARSSGRTR